VVDNDDIRWLIALAASEGLAELEVGGPDSSVLVRRHAAPGPPVPHAAHPSVPAACEVTDRVAVKAPMAGIFYRASAPDTPPFVEEGDEVQAGETVALIEAMKLFNDVETPCAGRVEKILAADGSRVAADQDLLFIRPLDETESFDAGA